MNLPSLVIVISGPSGVGKSSLINSLLGATQLATQESREGDNRSRHTTTWSEIVFLPEGGMVIDTPGMRDVQLWADEESLGQTCSDIEELSLQCEFRNCAHTREKGCAILAAIDSGTLDGKRYKSYLKQRREVEHISRQTDRKQRLAQKEKGKKSD